MRVETKQDECRLVAENDLENYYLDRFFTNRTLIDVKKTKDDLVGLTTITMAYANEPN